jgi:hypothetical protein
VVSTNGISRGFPAGDHPADKEQLLAAPQGFPSSFVHRSMTLGESRQLLEGSLPDKLWNIMQHPATI